MFRIIFIVLAFFYYCNGGFMFAQTKEELEQKRIEAEKIIENATQLLEETSRSRRTGVERLNIVNQRLKQRQNIINTIESEIRYLEKTITERENRISELNDELNNAKESYAQLINIAYKHRFSHQVLIFILSSENFNQAYRRFRYLQQYGRSRKKQISKIQVLTYQIVSELEDLEKIRKDKLSLLTQKQDETNMLSRERQQQNSVIRNLQVQETELQNEIQKQQKSALALEHAIKELLDEETHITDEKRIYELTRREKIISDGFQNNKGVLPWPIERGVITGYFGEHAHPVLSGIKIQNNGIDISTNDNAEVRSLFKGVVRSVLTVPGTNNVVIIRHGNYLTVYANLSHVYVRQGDIVDTKQLVGRVFTNENEANTSVLHLEIWEENTKLDPVIWLSQQ